jgi:hypothetical protein
VAAEPEGPHLLNGLVGGPAARFHPVDCRHGARSVLAAAAVDEDRIPARVRHDGEEQARLFLGGRRRAEDAGAHRNLDVGHPGPEHQVAFGRVRSKAHDGAVSVIAQESDARFGGLSAARQSGMDLREISSSLGIGHREREASPSSS